MMLRLLGPILLLAAAFQQLPVIRVDANLVLTPVRVTDAAGKTVRGLELDDFEIEENGLKAQPARLGAAGEAPLELALVFDTSGSVYAQVELERRAAALFLQRTLRRGDGVCIVAVANQPRVLLTRTSSLDTALRAVDAITPTTQATAFYNSLALAARMLEDAARPDARRVLIAISDGEDNRSLDHGLEDILKALRNTNSLFYSVNPQGAVQGTNYFSRRAQQNLDRIARETGGASFVADDIDRLTEFLDRIADELKGQYLLGYYSPSKTGAGIFRRIEIRVTGRPGVIVKARPGYYPD